MKNSAHNFLYLLFSIPAFGQQKIDSLLLKEDRGQPLNARKFEQELSEKYNGEEFNYNINDGAAQNLIERFLQWFFQTLRDNFGIDIPPEAIQIMEIFIYLLMGGLVIYLLVRFFIGERVAAIFTKNASGIIDINLSEAHIEQQDLDKLLKNALKANDFRLAIRYQYLISLKALSKNGVIDWHFEKTNWDYLKEISLPPLRTLFKEVSYIYDYIWYGEQPIDAEKYKAAERRFRELEKLIPR